MYQPMPMGPTLSLLPTARLNSPLLVDSDANRGTQTVKVTQGAVSATASLKIGVLPLDIQPAMAVPGQEITIQASGFEFNDKITSVTIGNQTPSVDATANSAGNIVITITIPSEGTEAIGNGTKTVSIQASASATSTTGGSNRIAEGSIEILEAAITLSPTTSLVARRSTLPAPGSPPAIWSSLNTRTLTPDRAVS